MLHAIGQGVANKGDMITRLQFEEIVFGGRCGIKAQAGQNRRTNDDNEVNHESLRLRIANTEKTRAVTFSVANVSAFSAALHSAVEAGFMHDYTVNIPQLKRNPTLSPLRT
jgi:hypothetical protein